MSKLNMMKNTAKAKAMEAEQARLNVKVAETDYMVQIIEVLEKAPYPLTCKEILDITGLRGEVSSAWLAGNLSAICSGNDDCGFVYCRPSAKFSSKRRSGDYGRYPSMWEKNAKILEASPVHGSSIRTTHLAELDDMGNIIRKWDKEKFVHGNTYGVKNK